MATYARFWISLEVKGQLAASIRHSAIKVSSPLKCPSGGNTASHAFCSLLASSFFSDLGRLASNQGVRVVFVSKKNRTSKHPSDQAACSGSLGSTQRHLGLLRCCASKPGGLHLVSFDVGLLGVDNWLRACWWGLFCFSRGFYFGGDFFAKGFPFIPIPLPLLSATIFCGAAAFVLSFARLLL